MQFASFIVIGSYETIYIE